MKYVLALLFGLFSGILAQPSSASARNYTAEPLPFASALPSREITHLHQDREGFIWIGTTYGVARYDGHETVLFCSDYAHPDRLTHNSITPITDTEHYVFIGTQSGLNVFDKRTWQITPLHSGPFSHTEIKYVYGDSENRLWVSTEQGLYCCDEDLHIRHHYKVGTSVTSVYEDRRKQLWIMTWGKGLFRLDAQDLRLISYPSIGKANIPFVMFEDNKGRYWIGTWGDGLYRFHPRQPEQTSAYERQEVEGSIYFDITQDDHSGNLWMLSYNSLHIFQPVEGRMEEACADLTFDPNRMYSKILKDREGNLWLGAYDAGYYISFNNRPTQVYSMPFIKRQTGFDANVNCMYEDSGGVLWFNQERCGVALYDKQTGAHNLHPYPQSRNVEINFITPSRGGNATWMSSKFIPSVFRAERNGLSFHFTDTVVLAESGNQTGHVIGIMEDRCGNLWALTERRLFVFNARRQPVTYPTNRLKDICCVTESHKGDVYLCSTDGRFYRALPTDSGFSVTEQFCDTTVFTANNRISHLCCDSTGNLWAATVSGGVYHYNIRKRRLTDCTSYCMPESQPILNLLASRQGLWLVTPAMVIRPDSAGQTCYLYRAQSRHIPIHRFRNSAACTGPDGQLYAGGYGGIVAIGAEKRTSGENIRPPMLTDIRIGGESLLGFSDNRECSFKQNLIQLPHTAQRIEFAFSNTSYDERENLRLAYRLKGLDSDPIVLDRGQYAAFYDRIPHGNYTLEVWLTDDNRRRLCPPSAYTVIKQPAYYETPWAYAGYLLAAMLLLWLVARYYIRQMRKKDKRMLQEEMERTKMEYFTNVSHELLTPLTILSCLSDEIEQNSAVPPTFVQTMRENTLRLKRLIRQVLDFRKIEKKSLRLHARYGDVAGFIRRITETDFSLLARKKGIPFHFDVHPDEIYGFYDGGILEEILFNLLSNAVKYTPPQHAVGISVFTKQQAEEKLLHIDIWDEGIGIAAEEQEKIFERFYRSPQRTTGESNGIGLALTRELVRLHHGQISLQSRTGQGSRFSVVLPLDETAYAETEKETQPVMPEPQETEPGTDAQADTTLLIVDDNPEITGAIKRLMGKRYRILSAHSAEQALPVVQEQPVDLMVCDLRMPGTNGLDFCRRLKRDLSTSHIPIIILTAQDDDTTRAACYEAGADAYMAKPFETKVLTARIDNLLRQYSLQRLQFRNHPEAGTAILPYQDRDKAFIDNIMQAIENHLQDYDFNLDFLAAELCLSKSTMNRKIKAMTGLTPMDFVKTVRLRTAARLLRQKDTTISDVAYAVGFSDPKYFAKCFKEEYGMTPTQFQVESRGTARPDETAAQP